MKKILLLAILALTFIFTGCDKVPAGHMGKILGPTGYNPEIIPPSTLWVGFREKLILVETTTQKYAEPITVLLKDKLSLSADIIFRGRINADDEQIANTIFNDMKLNDDVISTFEVYEVYGKMVVLNTAREVISKYTVDEVNQNYERITKELYLALEPKLAKLPIEISDVTLGNIQYPPIVTQAIEQAKEKQMAIEKMNAEVQIKLAEAKGREEIAKTEYSIKMMEAKRIRDYNKMTAEGITDKLLELRKLELREQELAKWDGKLPTTLMGGNTPVIVQGK